MNCASLNFIHLQLCLLSRPMSTLHDVPICHSCGANECLTLSQQSQHRYVRIHLTSVCRQLGDVIRLLHLQNPNVMRPLHLQNPNQTVLLVSVMLLQEPKQALRRQKRRFSDEDGEHDHLLVVKKQCMDSQDIPVIPAHCSQPARHPQQPPTRRPRVAKVTFAWNRSSDN